MSTKRIILSIGMLVFVAAVVISGTGAFFSDTETSTGNVFTAGAIDLKIDSEQHYNGNECKRVDGAVAGVYQWVGTNPYPVEGTPCTGTWPLKDLGQGDVVMDRFFNFDDIKPGDEGENTISLHVFNNDAYVCAAVSGLTDYENGQTEPEVIVDPTTGVNEGELSSTMLWKVWKDDGDNIWQTGEPILYDGPPTDQTFTLFDSVTGPLAASSTAFLGFSWTLPASSGNETQTDSMTADISFEVVQSRNNGEFVCGESDVTREDVSNEDFSNDLGDWENYLTGTFLTLDSGHATTNGDAFTRWGDYSSVFPVGGYTTEVDVYLDMADSTGASGDDAYFDFSSAINNQSGTHLRDFIFHVGHASAGQWSATVSNNSGDQSTAPQLTGPSPAAITTTGWYTLQSYFHDNGSGVLTVTMNLRDSSNAIVGTWTLSSPSDDIAGTVGGNRYGWFAEQPFNPLAFDNARLYLGAPTI